MKHLKALLVVAVLACAVFVGVASAHTGQIVITCNDATFSFSSFPAGSSNISYVIKTDGATTGSGTFTITGPTATKTIPHIVTGSHSVYAKASWTADGGGFVEKTTSAVCAPPCPSGYDRQPDGGCLKTVTVTLPPPPCAAGYDRQPDGGCLKTVTVTNTVEKTVFGNPQCVAPAVETGRGQGSVTCTVTNTVTKTVPGPTKPAVVKWKTRTVTVVKRGARYCPKPKPCPPGMHKMWDKKHHKYVCAVEGSG